MKARHNPFATSRVLRIRYRLPGLTWPQLLARLETLKFRAAIVGSHGSGKTTLLEDLEPHLIVRGFRLHRLRLGDQTRSFPRRYLANLFRAWGPRDCLLFDGADHLGRWAWLRCKRLARPLGGLIVTSHRPGLLPTLLQCRTSPGLLAGIMEDLCPSAETWPLAARLHCRHGGNLRDALRELYDAHAQKTMPPDNRPSRSRNQVAAVFSLGS